MKRFCAPLYYELRDICNLQDFNANNYTYTIDGNTAVVSIVFKDGLHQKVDLVKIDRKWKIAPTPEMIHWMVRKGIDNYQQRIDEITASPPPHLGHLALIFLFNFVKP